MSTNRPNGKLYVGSYSIRHNTGNGFVGIPTLNNLTESQVHANLRELRKQGDRRNFVVLDRDGKTVAHSEP